MHVYKEAVMDYSYIIRRAFRITWSYRALWVFGILLAITTGGFSRGGSSSGVEATNIVNVPDLRISPPLIPAFPFEFVRAFWPVMVGLLCLFFILAIAAAVIRYISETGAIRMVDRLEDSGEKQSVLDGFRLGWSTRAFKVFLIDLFFAVLMFILFLFFLMIAGIPLLVWLTEAETARIIGTVTAIGLFILMVLLFILVGIVYSLLSQFFRRAVIMENMGVFEAIGRGFSLVMSNLGGVIVAGILLLVITIIWGIVMIPVFIGIFLSAGILGFLPGLLAGWISTFFTQGDAPIIIGVFFGLPAFLLALLAPLLWLGGLYEIFHLSAWTITYRQAAGMVRRRLAPSNTDPLEPDPAI
jgi:hypothetical protein